MHAVLEAPETRATFRRDSQWSWFTASAFARAGDKEAALDWMENAVNRGFLNSAVLTDHDPFLSTLLGDERFAALIEKARKGAEAAHV